MVDRLEREFGIYKKVVDIETGKIHRVPTRDIIEKGLRHQDDLQPRLRTDCELSYDIR